MKPWIGFAVVPLDHEEATDTARAFFRAREDAVTWGARRHGAGRFQIAPISLVEVAPDDDRRAPSRA